MKTTIDIPDEVMQDALRYSGAKTKRDAVLAAMDEYNRKRRLSAYLDKAGRSTSFMPLAELKALREGKP